MEICGEVAEGSWIHPQPYGPQWLSKCHGLGREYTMKTRNSAQYINQRGDLCNSYGLLYVEIKIRQG